MFYMFLYFCDRVMQQLPKRSNQSGAGEPAPVVDIMYKVTNDGVTKGLSSWMPKELSTG